MEEEAREKKREKEREGQRRREGMEISRRRDNMKEEAR